MQFKQFNMVDVMNSLKENTKRIFFSESDFQFEMGQTIKSVYSDAKIFFEVPFSPSKNNKHIDIVVGLNNNIYPIELKYKRGSLVWREKTPWYNDRQIFQLGNESNRTLLIKDIERIKSLVMGNDDVQWNNVSCGYAVWLTNNKSYYNKNICDYKIEWSDFYDAKEINKNIEILNTHRNNMFKYAIVEIKNESAIYDG